VVGIPTPLKNMTSSVGMMTFPIYGEKIQTTNQIIIWINYPISMVGTFIIRQVYNPKNKPSVG
jgi:hypothetical protein